MNGFHMAWGYPICNVMFTMTKEQKIMDNTNDVFQFDWVMLDNKADSNEDTLSIMAAAPLPPPPLLIGGRYLEEPIPPTPPPNPPRGIIAAIPNVPSTIGHAEVCNNDAHTISTCRTMG